MDVINSLKASSIFKNLTSQDITYIIQKLNYKVKEFDKGETVYFRGDDVSHIIINIVGELYTEMQKYNGDVIEVGIIKQNDVLASAFIFGSSHKSPVDMITRTKCTMIFLETDNLLECMQQDEKFLRNVLDEISNKGQFLSKRIWFNFVNKSIEDKIIDYINTNTKNGVVNFKPSISELAKRFGVTRPSLSRELSNLCDKEILARIGRNKYNVNREKIKIL